MPIQAVLQGAGLISGLVQVELLDAGRCAEYRVMVSSLEASPTPCETDQFLFNLSSFYTEKKQILLNSVTYVSKEGRSCVANWDLLEDVESAFGRFYYSLICSDYGKPLEPGDTLIFRLELADEHAVFNAECFLDAPASTFNGFQGALVIKFPGNKQMLAGGQFESVPDA